MAAIQNKESITINGKNIFPYQYENGGFTEIRIRKESKEDTESLQLDMQGEDKKENNAQEIGRMANLYSPKRSPLRSPNILIENDNDVGEKQPIPLTISSVKLLPLGDNTNGHNYEDFGDIEIMNKPVKTGNSELDIQMSPNRTKIVGGGGVIMRTTSPRMQSHRKSSKSDGVRFLDTVERGPLQSNVRLDLMVSSVANMKLNKDKKKKGRHKKHSRSGRSKSRESSRSSPQRVYEGIISDEISTPKHKSSRGSNRRRDKTLVTFEDKKTAILENVETLQDRNNDSSSPMQYQELKMPRELKKKKSLSDLGKSQAFDVSVDDEYGEINVPFK